MRLSSGYTLFALLCASCALVHAPLLAQLRPGAVPPEAVQVGNCFYQYFPAENISWGEAEARCRSLGGQLAVGKAGWREIDAADLPKTKFMWVGFYSLREENNYSRIFQLDGVQVRTGRPAVIDGRPGNGTVFRSPVSDKEHRFGVYLDRIDRFPMDGYLCEWEIGDDGSLVETAPLVPIDGVENQVTEKKEGLETLLRKLDDGTNLRTFVSSDGKKLTGAVRYVTSRSAGIRDTEFKNFEIPLNRFSEDDRNYLGSLDGYTKPKVELGASVKGYWVDSYFPSPIRPPANPGSTPQRTNLKVPAILVTVQNPSEFDTGEILLVLRITNRDIAFAVAEFLQSRTITNIPAGEEKKEKFGFRFTRIESDTPLHCEVYTYRGSQELYSETFTIRFEPPNP